MQPENLIQTPWGLMSFIDDDDDDLGLLFIPSEEPTDEEINSIFTSLWDLPWVPTPAGPYTYAPRTLLPEFVVSGGDDDCAEDPIFLYVLMRNDLKSMTPGRAAAHAAHAANQMVHEISGQDPETSLLPELLDEWQAQANGFGTTIVLQAPIDTIREIIDSVDSMGAAFGRHNMTVAGGMVRDPTYPLRDGDVTHLLDLETCAYVFARRESVRGWLSDLPLL